MLFLVTFADENNYMNMRLLKIVFIIASLVMNAHKINIKKQVICRQGNNVWAFPF